MLPHVWTTLRVALRAPSVWALALLGVLSVLVGLSLSVLAVGDLASTGNPLLRESTRTTAVLAGLWILGLGHDMDLVSGFTPALDSTRPGTAGRRLGRLVGSLAAAFVAAVPTAWMGALMLGGEGPSAVYLLITSMSSVLLLLAWAQLFLAATSSATAALVGALLLWVAGHLPWGQAAWGGPDGGRLAAALLPGGSPGAETLAALGLLAVGAALPRGQSARA